MKSLLVVILCFCLFASNVIGENKVDVSRACGKIDEQYDLGAAGFIADLLGLPYQPAEKYVQGRPIGSKVPFNATSGDVVGFPGGMYFLAIYIGGTGCPCDFLDVPDDTGNVRCWQSDYGMDLYEYSYPQ